MKQAFWVIPLSFLLALGTQLTMHAAGLDVVRFRMFGGGREKPELEQTILQFNRNYATFFDTGGLMIGLNEFPATDLVKRRIFHDINLWKANGLWLIHDKQALEISGIAMPSPDRAIVDTRELWQIWPKVEESGQKGRGSKTVAIRVRYFLYRDARQWVVWDFKVFAQEDEMPPVERELL